MVRLGNRLSSLRVENIIPLSRLTRPDPDPLSGIVDIVKLQNALRASQGGRIVRENPVHRRRDRGRLRAHLQALGPDPRVLGQEPRRVHG